MTDRKLGVPDLLDPKPPIIVAKNGQRSNNMGKKLPIKDSVRREYAREIALSEQMAESGFDKSKTGANRINEVIYGPTQMGSIDPLNEMKILEEQGITDSSFREAAMAELEQRQNDDTRIKAAIAAVQAEQRSIPQPSPPADVPQAPVNQEVSPAPAEMLSEDPEERLEQVAKKLREQFSNAPTADVLRQWKAMHGDIFLLPIDDRVYIYRYLKRQEWAQMQANAALQEMRPDQHEDLMFNKCLLWPRLAPEQLASLPAGAVTLIVEQVRLQSLFLDPVQVASLTLKL